MYTSADHSGLLAGLMHELHVEVERVSCFSKKAMVITQETNLLNPARQIANVLPVDRLDLFPVAENLAGSHEELLTRVKGTRWQWFFNCRSEPSRDRIARKETSHTCVDDSVLDFLLGQLLYAGISILVMVVKIQDRSVTSAASSSTSSSSSASSSESLSPSSSETW